MMNHIGFMALSLAAGGLLVSAGCDRAWDTTVSFKRSGFLEFPPPPIPFDLSQVRPGYVDIRSYWDSRGNLHHEIRPFENKVFKVVLVPATQQEVRDYWKYVSRLKGAPAYAKGMKNWPRLTGPPAATSRPRRE